MLILYTIASSSNNWWNVIERSLVQKREKEHFLFRWLYTKKISLCKGRTEEPWLIPSLCFSIKVYIKKNKSFVPLLTVFLNVTGDRKFCGQNSYSYFSRSTDALFLFFLHKIHTLWTYKIPWSKYRKWFFISSFS